MLNFTSRGIIFIALNAIRILSLIALILVFASNIEVIVHDIQGVNRFINAQSAGSLDDDMLDCDYIMDTTVPNQPAGIFWAVVNRLLILGECIFLILSEVGFPMKFFDRFFPVLGSNFGVGALGVFQALIGAAVLSHHVDTFALVSAFFLFSVACLNMLVGLIFREKVKSKRAFNPATSDLPTIGSLKPMMTGSSKTNIFPNGFTNVTKTESTYSVNSTDKTPAPAYGAQAANAFGRATEKAAAASPVFLNRAIGIAKPEEAHPHSSPRVNFITRRMSPDFESSPGNAV